MTSLWRGKVGRGFCLIAALSMAGCAVGPNYHRPPVQTPAQFKYSSDPASTNSLADLAWWQVFNDPTLTNLIHIALANNYDVRIAATRVEQSRALAVQARCHANYFEVLDAQQQLFPQENALAQTQLNQLLIIVRLYKSLGGGWNQPETTAPAR